MCETKINLIHRILAIHPRHPLCVRKFMLFEMFIIHLQHLIVGRRVVCRNEIGYNRGGCMEIKRLCSMPPKSETALRIIRHGNFNDDTQRHSKNALNYFWLMHSIILFDILILLCHSLSMRIQALTHYLFIWVGARSPVHSSFGKECCSKWIAEKSEHTQTHNPNENDKLRECYRCVQQFY